MVYILNRPLFRRFKKNPKTNNNNRFYVLKVFFSSHDNRFSVHVTSLLNISLQSWCILFKKRKIDVFGRIGAYFCLVSIERGRGQDKYFYRRRSYNRLIHPQSIELVHDIAQY